MDPSQLSILVVDDSRTTRNLLCETLKVNDYNVTPAANGKQALALMKVEQYDLILLDYEMPDMNGPDVLKIIHATDSLKHIPVIMCTSHIDPEHVNECISMGISDYIAKPLNLKVVRNRIWKCLLNHHLNKKPDRPSNLPHSDMPATVLVVDDSKINAKVVARHIVSSGHEPVIANSGAEALEILHQNPIDIIMLDIVMPELDGFQVLERIKQDKTLKNIPIIMISSLDKTDEMGKCFELGADDYICKPFKAALLKLRLDSVLSTRRQLLQPEVIMEG